MVRLSPCPPHVQPQMHSCWCDSGSSFAKALKLRLGYSLRYLQDKTYLLPKVTEYHSILRTPKRRVYAFDAWINIVDRRCVMQALKQ